MPDNRDCDDERTFGRITAELTDRQAVVLWLRGYCGLSVEAAAPLLKLSPRSVEAWTRSALATLLEKNLAELRPRGSCGVKPRKRQGLSGRELTRRVSARARWHSCRRE